VHLHVLILKKKLLTPFLRAPACCTQNYKCTSSIFFWFLCIVGTKAATSSIHMHDIYIYICIYIHVMMIAFITFNSSLLPLIEGVCSSNPCEFEFSVLDGIEPAT